MPKKNVTPFKNRIVGSGQADIDQILFNPMNWRIHPQTQYEALDAVLEEVGYVQEIIINQRTGNLVDGHLRVTIAKKHGEKSIPCKYVDISPEEEALILATFDPLGAMAARDGEKLNELLSGINTQDETLQALLAELRDKEADYAAGGFEDVPDMEDYTEPDGALRAIIEFEDAEEQAQFFTQAGIEPEGGRIRYKFSELKFGNGSHG